MTRETQRRRELLTPAALILLLLSSKIVNIFFHILNLIFQNYDMGF